jgi:hypothetical protein
MADYSQDRADAYADILEAGGLFQLFRENVDAPDPDKPWRKETVSAASGTISGVLTYYRKTLESQGFTAGSEDTRAIMPGDMLMLVAAEDPGLPFVPAPRDILEGVDGERYVVISIETVAPDGIPILYRVQVRK